MNYCLVHITSLHGLYVDVLYVYEYQGLMNTTDWIGGHWFTSLCLQDSARFKWKYDKTPFAIANFVHWIRIVDHRRRSEKGVSTKGTTFWEKLYKLTLLYFERLKHFAIVRLKQVLTSLALLRGLSCFSDITIQNC